MPEAKASTKPFDLVHHLLTTPSEGRVADVVMRLPARECILPIALEGPMATLPAEVLQQRGLAFMLRAASGI